MIDTLGSVDPPATGDLAASVVITTYNRREALELSLDAFTRQTVSPRDFEILVVDDGCTDDTWAALTRRADPFALRLFRQPGNRGISAARNVALGEARGRYVILVSDDLVVPEEFLATHLRTHDRFPGCWVVGGIRQLESISATPFGRYLDALESSWEEARKTAPLEPNIWELSWPTARNLSLPRADLDRTGLFDEQFRMSCEDQDLAHHARAAGIRFLYNAAITCLHNDQVGDLHRFCRAQVPRMRDTALFCDKWKVEHGNAPVGRLNGYMRLKDGPWLLLRKLIKVVSATRPATACLEMGTDVAERLRLPDPMLMRLYSLLIGAYMFRGWREGLRVLERRAVMHTNRPDHERVVAIRSVSTATRPAATPMANQDLH